MSEPARPTAEEIAQMRRLIAMCCGDPPQGQYCEMFGCSAVAKLLSEVDALAAQAQRDAEAVGRLREQQAGIEVILGQLRRATEQGGAGTETMLVPCERCAAAEQEIARLRERNDVAEEALARATDIANSWARESRTPQAERPATLPDVIECLWVRLSADANVLRQALEAAEQRARALEAALKAHGTQSLDDPTDWCWCGGAGVYDETQDSGHTDDCRQARAALAPADAPYQV